MNENDREIDEKYYIKRKILREKGIQREKKERESVFILNLL